MLTLEENFAKIKATIPPEVKLVAVSKTKPAEAIRKIYDLGQRDFGESKAQDLLPKYEELPKDIHWHMIGHLQTNKVKYIAPYVSLIHSVDSLKLLNAINKEALKIERIIDCLLQMHIAEEETKFGLSYDEVVEILNSEAYSTMKNIRITGLMCMATFTNNQEQIRREFKQLTRYFDDIKETFFKNNDGFRERSMGMSDDYQPAIEEGSTMVRVGSLIFGDR